MIRWQAALDGARAILVERFAEDADLIGALRERMWGRGRLVSKVRDGKAEERDWVGWNPNGPYEYSDRKAERWIGWHFNPVKMNAAATFGWASSQSRTIC